MSILSGANKVGDPRGLAKHLGKEEEEDLWSGLIHFATRGLAALNLRGAMDELVAGAVTTRTTRALYHVHVNPRFENAIARALWWKLFESEFALKEAKYLAATHRLGQRGDHEHRVYCVTLSNGKVINLRFDYLRRQKVSVLVCHQLGLPVPPIAHPKSVEAALRADGRDAVAAWLMADPRSRAPRRVAITPAQRQQAARTGLSPIDIQDAAWAAWGWARDGPTLLQGLVRAGLTPAIGRRKDIALVDHQGGLHGLRRLLKAASKRKGEALDAAALASALAALTFLPTVEDVQRDRKTQSAQPRPGALPGTLHPGPAQPDPRGDAHGARAPGAPGGGGGDEPHRGGAGGHGDGRPGEHQERVDPGLAGPAPSLAARAAARARARLLMARRPVRDLAEEEARRAATEAARLAREEAARIEAVAIHRDAERTISESVVQIAIIEKEMEEIRRRRQGPAPEHVDVARHDAVIAAAELATAERVLQTARQVLGRLPAAPRPGFISKILGRLPWRRRRAEERVMAERAVKAALNDCNSKRETYTDADSLRGTVERDWERANVVLGRAALKQRAERLSEMRGLIALLRWRPAYIRRLPEEIAEAIRRRVWQDDDEGGGGGTAPPAAPPAPAGRP